jgi:cell division septation protein DedD
LNDRQARDLRSYGFDVEPVGLADELTLMNDGQVVRRVFALNLPLDLAETAGGGLVNRERAIAAILKASGEKAPVKAKKPHKATKTKKAPDSTTEGAEEPSATPTEE